MRARGRSTALGFVLYALEAAEKFADVSMYSRRAEANMRAALDMLERYGDLALGWLSPGSPCQGADDLAGYVIASGERTPWADRIAVSGCIEGTS